MSSSMFEQIPSFYVYILGFAVVWWLSNQVLVPKPLPGIPYNGPARWMPWGDLSALGVHNIRTGSVFDWLGWQCIKHRSPVVQILVPAFSTSSPVLLIADLHEVMDIIVKRSHEIDRAPLVHYWFEVLMPNASTSMATTSAFKRQRRLWNCILSPDFIDNVATPAFEVTMRRSINLWAMKSALTDNRPFLAYEDICRITLEGIWRMLFGSNLGLADASIQQLESHEKNAKSKPINTANVPSETFPDFFYDFTFLLTGLNWVIAGVSPRMYKWIFNHLPPIHRSMDRMKNLFQSFIIEQRNGIIAASSTTRCGLNEVLRQNDGKIPDSALVDELIELLITGHETTASTTSWGLKYLADHQEVQERLYDAIKHVFPHATISDLPQGKDICQASIPYLDAVIAEILRMACTGPVLFKETAVDCEILGHRIPARTPLLLVTQSPPAPDMPMLGPDTFRRKEDKGPMARECGFSTAALWNSSFDQFIPERWLDNNGQFDPNAGLSLPFSAGRRGCFGRRIAMVELRLSIAMLVLSFHFRQLPKKMSKYNSTDNLTRQPACCYVSPVPRV